MQHATGMRRLRTRCHEEGKADCSQLMASMTVQGSNLQTHPSSRHHREHSQKMRTIHSLPIYRYLDKQSPAQQVYSARAIPRQAANGTTTIKDTDAARNLQLALSFFRDGMQEMLCSALDSLIEECTVILGWCYTSAEVEDTKRRQRALMAEAMEAAHFDSALCLGGSGGGPRDN